MGEWQIHLVAFIHGKSEGGKHYLHNGQGKCKMAKNWQAKCKSLTMTWFYMKGLFIYFIYLFMYICMKQKYLPTLHTTYVCP